MKNDTYSISLGSLDLSDAPAPVRASTPWTARPRRTPLDGEPLGARLMAGLWHNRSRRLLITFPVLVALLGAVAGVVFAASIHRPEVDGLADHLPRLATTLVGADGEEIRKYSRENRALLKEGELPTLLAHAIVDTEDARFYQHGGVDPKSVARAVVVNLVTGRRSEGASTLTMQYARGVFQLTRQKAWWRKIEEAFLAVELEKKFSKQQILTMYANHVNLGHGNYGMKAGARAYFDKDVHELNLQEAATLAGIPQRPSAHSVYNNPELVIERRDKVLRRMLTMQHITEDEYLAATNSPLEVVPRHREDAQVGPYFNEEVRRHLIATYGANALYDQGLRVTTTLAPKIQEATEEALQNQLKRLHRRLARGQADIDLDNPDLEGAAVVIETQTGAVRAMVGGFDYGESEFNRVTQAKRQVGSAFKLFVYGAALEHGFTPADTIFDGPVLFPGAGNKLTYSPRNHARKYYGITTLRSAMERSLNVTAVKVFDMVGGERVIDMARRSGIESPLQPFPSLALGSAELVPLELAAAYATVANGGVWVEPYWIESVTSHDGRLLEAHQTQGRRAMTPQVAYVLRRMLEGVATRGSARRLRDLPVATAGKTGTTNRSTDAWFVGFTPRYTILTWVGRDQKQPIGPNMTGSAAALPVWQAIVEKGLAQGWIERGGTFPGPPTDIVEAVIDRRSGLLARAGSQDAIQEAFLSGTEPNRPADADSERLFSLPWYLQEPFYLPKEGERMPSETDDWQAAKARWAL